jgi:hypothetical protein
MVTKAIHINSNQHCKTSTHAPPIPKMRRKKEKKVAFYFIRSNKPIFEIQRIEANIHKTGQVLDSKWQHTKTIC